MALTSIGNQLTPGTPTEITFAGETGLPNPNQSLIIIGHVAAVPPTGTTIYDAFEIGNVADPVAASGEAAGLFGAGSELAEMIVAAVAANANSGNFPPITAIPLAFADTDYGSALVTADKLQGNYLVSPYDGNNQTLADPLLAKAEAMSSPQRVEQAQYGCLAVMANRSVTTPASLFEYDTAYGTFCWLRDTSSPTQRLGSVAAAYAAQLAGNGVPYNPMKNVVLPNVTTPAKQSDWISVGAGMESELALSRGWSPLRVLPNGSVAHLRDRVLRITTGDGVTAVTSYFDVMDFNVLFFWRKTLVTRFNQPDLTQVKASLGEAQEVLSEVIRLATLFEDQGMFQNVQNLAKQFVVQRNVSDRSRFDVFTPVNVIPILAVIATNVQATTVGDTLTI